MGRRFAPAVLLTEAEQSEYLRLKEWLFKGNPFLVLTDEIERNPLYNRYDELYKKAWGTPPEIIAKNRENREKRLQSKDESR